jgi:hypothetical protein
VISLQGFFVAATVAALVQWLRLKEKRLLPLLAMFALLSLAHFQEEWFAARRYHLAAGVSGLVLLVMISPRPPARPAP